MRVYPKGQRHTSDDRRLHLILETPDHYVVQCQYPNGTFDARVYVLPKPDYQLTEPTEGDDLI